MKFIHVGDLHIGKRIYEFSMLEDQQHMLKQILQLAEQEKPDAVLLAGDIYDKSVPSAEAVQLFDWFLTSLAAFDLSVFVIAGNHDSPERLQFGSQIFQNRRVYITGVFQGKLEHRTLTDSWGDVDIHCLPYVKPAAVRRFYPDGDIAGYQEAIEQIMSTAEVDRSLRNILICHQFVTAQGIETQQCESELIAVGGVECVDVSLFDDFDYVALGHLHSPQKIGRETARYGGSILKYSFSEAQQVKSVVLGEIREKGDVTLRQVPLKPLRDMRQIRGPLDQLTKPEVVSQANALDYLQVTLTDREPVGDPMGRIRAVYPNVMNLAFDRGTGEQAAESSLLGSEHPKSTMELFEEFFLMQNGAEMNEEQKALMTEIIREEEEAER